MKTLRKNQLKALRQEHGCCAHRASVAREEGLRGERRPLGSWSFMPSVGPTCTLSIGNTAIHKLGKVQVHRVVTGYNDLSKHIHLP